MARKMYLILVQEQGGCLASSRHRTCLRADATPSTKGSSDQTRPQFKSSAIGTKYRRPRLLGQVGGRIERSPRILLHDSNFTSDRPKRKFVWCLCCFDGVTRKRGY